MKNEFLNTRAIRFAGNTVTFEIEPKEILKAVDMHFKHCLGGGESPLAQYQVRAEEEAGLFSILRDGEVMQSRQTSERVLFHLMQDGLTQLNGAPKSHLIFHAAALAHQSRGLLLCGKSGCGKSTLAAWLISKGFGYLTDEVIAYPLSAGEVSGFPRSLVLKRGSAAIWERWLEGANANDYIKMEDGSAWITPTLLNPAAMRGQMKPHLVLFPTYKADVELEVEKLSPAGTVFNLLQCLVNARNFEDHGMATVKQLSQSVSAYRLVYSDIEQAEAWIRTTLLA